MKLAREQLSALETPCIIIDVDTVRRNVMEMQHAADAAGCVLRPHIKTHKMPFFAHMQLQAGARGVTCAKVSEAEVMADSGVEDIFIAYPMVGAARVERAVALSRRVQRLILSVDSLPGAIALDAAARAAGTMLEVRLEVDTGAGRTGVPLEHAAALAQRIAAMPGLRLTGIYTFKGLIYQGAPTQDNILAAKEEGEMMAEAARSIRAAGVAIQDVSAGSSPTGVAVAQTGLVTEVRPGTYIFKDQLLCREHVAKPDEIALRYAATVVSTPKPELAVLDGGSKTFATDIPLGGPPFYFSGYAAVEGRPDLCLARMNEEHGILTAAGGKTNLRIGDVLMLTPVHACTAINAQNFVYLLENGALRRERVAARGMTL